jgi:hypothetical protein
VLTACLSPSTACTIELLYLLASPSFYYYERIMYGQSNRRDPPSQPEWRLPPRPSGVGPPPPPPPPPAAYKPATYGPISNSQIQGRTPAGSGADTSTWGVRFNQSHAPPLPVSSTVRGMLHATDSRIASTFQHQRATILPCSTVAISRGEYQSCLWIPIPRRSAFSASIHN